MNTIDARDRALGLIVEISRIRVEGAEIWARSITSDLSSRRITGITSEERQLSRELKAKEEARRMNGGWRVQTSVTSDDRGIAEKAQQMVIRKIMELGGVIQPGTGIVSQHNHVLDGGGAGYYWEDYGTITNVVLGVERSLKNDARVGINKPDRFGRVEVQTVRRLRIR